MKMTSETKWPDGWNLTKHGDDYVIHKDGVGGAVVLKPDYGDAEQSIAEAILFYLLRDAHEATSVALATPDADSCDGWRSTKDHVPTEDEQYWINFRWASGAEGQGYGIWMDGDWFFDVDDFGDLVSRQKAIKMMEGDDDHVAEVTHFREIPPSPADTEGA